jgi:hypothetical protein
VIFGIIVKNLFYQWGQRPVGRIAINLADHSRTLAETQAHWWFSMKIFGKIESHLFGHQAGAWHHQRHCRKNQQSHFINL